MMIDTAMEKSIGSLNPLRLSAKSLVRRLAIIGENRLELLALEIQEESERIQRALLLGLGVAALALLTGLTFTAAITVLLWAYCPMAALLTLGGLYGVAAFYLYQRLNQLLGNWQTLAASLDQIRKDRACLETIPT
jgi:uncharacterized membrane protein YqjE